jgi:Ca2+-binding RTX toxin-like protein
MPKASYQSTPLDGTPGNDVLEGTRGVDFMEGYGGDDTLSGNGGQDVFVFAIGHGDDVVTDFKESPRGYAHSEKLTFGGFGRFVGGAEQAGPEGADVADGSVYQTVDGHTLTVTDTGSDLLLSWSTGDSVLLVGVNVFDASALFSF